MYKLVFLRGTENTNNVVFDSFSSSTLVQALYQTTYITSVATLITSTLVENRHGSIAMMIGCTYLLPLMPGYASYVLPKERMLSTEGSTSNGYEDSMSGFILLQCGQVCVQIVALAQNDNIAPRLARQACQIEMSTRICHLTTTITTISSDQQQPEQSQTCCSRRVPLCKQRPLRRKGQCGANSVLKFLTSSAQKT